MFGRQPKNSEKSALTYLAGLAKDAGDDLGTALQLSRDAMPADQRALLVQELLRLCPPSVRLHILAGVFDAKTISEMHERLSAQERRPLIVGALIEEARQKQKIDLAAIPTETSMSIYMYPNNSGYLEAQAKGLKDINQRMDFTAQVLGNTEFASLTTIAPLRKKSGNRSYHDIPAGRAFSLRSLDVHNEPTTVVRYGAPLTALFNGQELQSCYDGGVDLFVGNIALDNQPVFYKP